MNKPIDIFDIEADSENSLPEPFKSKMGHSEWRGLGDHFGLTQYGVNLEVLHPGSRSSIKHWHSGSDEFVYIIEGDADIIVGDRQYQVCGGMCIGFKAGVEEGHCIVNRSSDLVKFMVIGSRVQDDRVCYPDDDLQWQKDCDGAVRAARKDGSFY